jgi:predicted alpha/beta superfamily hydrolase
MRADIVIHYPTNGGRLVIRCEEDWERDIEPVEVSEDGTQSVFVIESEEDMVMCKPCLYRDDALHLAVGNNRIVPIGTGIPFNSYPHFFGTDEGRISSLAEIESKHGSPRRVRLYLPPGYDENTLERYPVIYMQDGANLFLPDEAYASQDWGVDDTMDVLDQMGLIRASIVVGIHAQERMDEYTEVGYEEYGRSLKEEIKPWVDEQLRTLPGPGDTFVIGSSLGGVVSFYLGWEWPEVFGNVACLSSTFGYRDDLTARVRYEQLGARKGLKIYLDSGWPKDNYEATLTMTTTLIGRGFQFGRDLMHCAFPLDKHTEKAWGGRLHLPIQFFAGHPRQLTVLMSERDKALEAARKTEP